MSQLDFYRRPVPLSSHAHRALRLRGAGDFRFASSTNCVTLAGIEFSEAAKEYPIVFAKLDGHECVPVILLGLKDRQNVFVTKSGAWDARYIPAFVRCYPFVLASGESDKSLNVFIDEECESWSDSDGDALFSYDGAHSPFLDQKLKLLSSYHAELATTRNLARVLVEYELLSEITARADLSGGGKYILKGLHIIDEAKLQQLSPEQAVQLLRSGLLALIYAHLMSLSNTARLVDRMVTSA
jgi:hypothetical protein